MQQTYTSPDRRDSTKLFQKLLIIAMLKDANTRKIAEDKLAEEVRPRGAVSYNYLPDYNATPDTTLIADKLKLDGFDGIIIMRLLTLGKNTVNSPGSSSPYYNSWYQYYSSSFPLYNKRNNNSANEIYNIETSVYSLTENKLLWSGVTTAVNISDKSLMIDKVIAAVKQRMKKEGFIKE